MPICALAARPLVTDDARLTTAGSCQVESWVRTYPDSRELWMLPACNPTGNVEFTVGGGRASADGENTTSDYLLQAKTVFRQLAPNDWAWGLAIGTIRHPQITPGPNMLGNTYAYIPLSFSLQDDRVIVHANLGLLKDKASARHNASWGVGAELKWHPRLLGIAETYGDNRGAAFGQLGVRYALIPEVFQLDATFGREIGGPGSARWISFGLRYTPDKLF